MSSHCFFPFKFPIFLYFEVFPLTLGNSWCPAFLLCLSCAAHPVFLAHSYRSFTFLCSWLWLFMCSLCINLLTQVFHHTFNIAKIFSASFFPHYKYIVMPCWHSQRSSLLLSLACALILSYAHTLYQHFKTRPNMWLYEISPVCTCHVGSNSALQVLARPDLWDNCNIILMGLLNKDVPILNDKGISWTESSWVSVVGDRFAPLVRKNSPDFLRRGFKIFLSLEETKEHLYLEK